MSERRISAFPLPLPPSSNNRLLWRGKKATLAPAYRAWKQEAVAGANATLTLTVELWVKLATRQAGPAELALSDDFSIEGSTLDLISFFRLLDSPDGRFAIVTP